MKSKLQELAAPGPPDLHELSESYDWCINGRDSSIFTRQKLNHDTRFCIWPGQSQDGRKWDSGNTQAWPWNGASDVRTPLVDCYVGEDKAVLMTVWRRNKILVSGTQADDLKWSARLTQLLRWLRYTQMKEYPREIELCVDYMLGRGSAVVGAFWEAQTQLGYDTLDMEKLREYSDRALRALDAGQVHPEMEGQFVGIATLPDLILDPATEDQAVAILQQLYDDVKPVRLKTVVRDLREQGHAEFPRPYLVRNRPVVTTLLPNEEIFISPESGDFQSSPAMHRSEIISEATLRERVVSKNWDEEFVNTVVETQRGNVTRDITRRIRNTASNRISGLMNLRTENSFEIVHSFRRLADAEGVIGIYYTCWSPGITEKSSRRKRDAAYAWHGLLNYDHGEYPFVHFELETRSRLLDDSRGYGERLFTEQNQVKQEWDSRIDRASLATLPPSFYPPDQPLSDWGPGAQIPTMQPERYGFMEAPKYDPGSKEIEKTIWDFTDRYLGRPVDDRNLVAAQAIQQNLADKFMEHCGKLDTQILQLEQQFAPEELVFRVVGSDKGRVMRASREEIQGQFDVRITYNIANLDLERTKPMFDLIDRALAWDMGGRVDRDELIAFGFDIFEPGLAERLLKPGQQAAAAEIEDEADALGKLFSGVPVDIKPGQAYQLRLQYANETIAQSPALLKKYQGDDDIRKLVDKHLQQLNHQVEQFTVNAKIGKLGA